MNSNSNQQPRHLSRQEGEFLAHQLGVDPSQLHEEDVDVNEFMNLLQYEMNNPDAIRRISPQFVTQILSSSGLITISPGGSIYFNNMTFSGFQSVLRNAYAQSVRAQPNYQGQVRIVSPSPAPAPAPPTQSPPTAPTGNKKITTINIEQLSIVKHLFAGMTDAQIIEENGKEVNMYDLAVASEMCLLTEKIVVQEGGTTPQNSASGKAGSWNKRSNSLKLGCPCMASNVLCIIKTIGGKDKEIGNTVVVPDTFDGILPGLRKLKLHMLECPSVDVGVKEKIRNGIEGGEQVRGLACATAALTKLILELFKNDTIPSTPLNQEALKAEEEATNKKRKANEEE